MDGRFLVAAFKVDEVINLHGTDALSAFPLSQKVNQQKIRQCQTQGGHRKNKGKMVRLSEKGKHQCPERLVNQIAQQNAGNQCRAAYNEVFLEEHFSNLFIFQPDKDVSPKLPAPAGKHEIGGILHQPGDNADHHKACQDNDQRHCAHHFAEDAHFL